MIFPVPEIQPDIKMWFVFDSISPHSGMPATVEQNVVGTPFPIREERPMEAPVPAEAMAYRDLDKPIEEVTMTHIPDSVAVSVTDTIKSLRLFGRHVAADWYEEIFPADSKKAEYQVVYPTSEGRLMPAGLIERLLPGLEEFDYLQPNTDS